ncbi:Rv2175c family DNA-binding protein [Pseudokineococcus sp. 5B2Z-1]|uniref:Rv2175c family DNA-binding protein n=1 Tax=Pseudokineococcus sp. 5B2Z-1 TaxID=3132744 RepID=UPI00309ED60D
MSTAPGAPDDRPTTDPSAADAPDGGSGTARPTTAEGSALADLEGLVGEWWTLAEVAEHLDLSVSQVRRLVADRDLVAVRRGKPRADCVPRALADPEPLRRLRGTAVLLADAGYSDAEALRWLFTPDPSLPGTPVEALRAEHRTTEVRRRAQALAF